MKSIFLPGESGMTVPTAKPISTALQARALNVAPDRGPLVRVDLVTTQRAATIQPNRRFLRRHQVRSITGLPDSTLYRYMKLGLFPSAHQLGPNTVGWLESEVQAWCASRAVA